MAFTTFVKEEDYKQSNKTGSIGLVISKPALPDQIEIEGVTMHPKEEMHITLVALPYLLQRAGIEDEQATTTVASVFRKYVEQNKIEFLSYKDEFRIVKGEDNASLIVRCEVSNLSGLYKALGAEYNTQFELPPTHVTLFTQVYNKGIFIVDENDLNTITHRIDAPKGLILDN